MLRGIISAIVLLWLCLPASAQTRMEDQVLTLINQYREKKDLPPLAPVKLIAAQAEKHSRNMANRKVPFGHSGFDNRMNLLISKLPGANAAAENVAYGARTAEEVVEMWLNSSGHKKNIKGNYNLTGIGIAKSRNGTLYFTQIFIRRKEK